MSYTKHNFQTGNVLYASQLREMDNKIYDMDADIASINETLGTNQTGVQSIAEVQTSLENALTKGRMAISGNNLNADLYMDPGSYFVDYNTANTPFHDTDYYDYTGSPNATGYLFVFGHRDAGNASQNFLCQLFVEGARDLTASEVLQELMDPTFSTEIGKIYTRYYNPSNSTWGDWVGYVTEKTFIKRINAIEDRLDALEGSGSGSGGSSDEQGKGDEPQAGSNE